METKIKSISFQDNIIYLQECDKSLLRRYDGFSTGVTIDPVLLCLNKLEHNPIHLGMSIILFSVVMRWIASRFNQRSQANFEGLVENDTIDFAA